MTRTEELLKLAEEAMAVESLDVDDGDVTFNGGSTSWNRTQRNFFRALTPETIKQLVELVRLQHEALQTWVKCCEISSTIRTEVAVPLRAIEAFNKWENGE